MLGIARAQHVRPIRPRRRRRTFLRRLGHKFHLEHAFAAFTDGLAHAVVTRIATANHQDLAALRAELFGILFARHFGAVQKVESKENTFGFAARDFQVTGVRCTDGEEHLVIILVDVFSRNVLTDFGIVDKLNASRLEQGDTTVDNGLVQFPVRNAVTQQATRLFAFFVNGNGIALTAERLGSKQACRTRADDRGSLPVRFSRRQHHATFLEGGLDDELLDLANHHRVVMHVAGTGGFAKRRTNAARKLREERRLADDFVSAFRISYGNRSVKFGNEVSKRATCTMAERDSAGVAATRLADDFD